MTADERSLIYRVVMAVGRPVVRWWGRLTVTGAELLREPGPLVLMSNHDSLWDPVVIGEAALQHRQVRALAKASLWKVRPVGRVLDGMRQIPIQRGRGDLTALAAAVDVLRAGGCVGVFPEGTVSRGRTLRALSGAGRLVLSVPDARVIGVAVTGVVDIVRFPKRPRIRVEFFEPRDGQAAEGESAVSLTKRVMAQAREIAPPAVPGRDKKAEQYRQALTESAAK